MREERGDFLISKCKEKLGIFLINVIMSFKIHPYTSMPALLLKELIADHLAVTKYKRLFFRRNEPDLHTSSSSTSKISIIQSV